MRGIINSSTDLINGGCNACPTFAATMYTLTLEEVTTPLEELDVNSLVLAVALKNGFRQELVMDFMDEYVIFVKGAQKIKFIEAELRTAYQNEEQEILLAQHYAEQEELFAKANQVLTVIFGIESVDFERATEE